MKEKRLNEIKGIILLSASLIIFASLISFDPNDLAFNTSHPNIPPHNLIRTFGAYLAGLLFISFGWSAFLLPVFVCWWGIGLVRQNSPDLRAPRLLGGIVLLLSASALLGVFFSNETTRAFYRSGLLGYLISKFTIQYFGRLGSYILFTTLFSLSFILVSEVLLSTFIMSLTNRIRGTVKPINLPKLPKLPKLPNIPNLTKLAAKNAKNVKENFKAPKINIPEEKETAKQPEPAPFKPKVVISQEKEGTQAKAALKQPVIKSGTYQLPTLDMLQSPPPPEARQIKEDLTNNARILEDTLGDFGIAVKVTDIERGPIITRYELEPAPGVKLNRIVALGDDIALAMKAQSVRIVAPIPGKARVGVEVPNIQSSLVYLKEVLSCEAFQKSDKGIMMALGKDIAGKPVVADLAKMPHLLIAGTTGSGKTVCVNSIILSLLFKAPPDKLKFVMIDPKMVELAQYNGLPHLLCPVVTEAKKASAAFAWTINEMEERYRLLADIGVRNIEQYNLKAQQPFPYIVVVVDEFADLMMVAREEIETGVTRLAQLSRAVGIHLVLATQRPSVDVITGVIKANLPARISFKVASKVDSRTVLDMNGADKLLGKGDMLLSKPDEAKLIRAQAALVGDQEIERVVDFIKSQAEPVYNEEILKENSKSSIGSGDRDEFYEEAVRIVMESGQASVSILQRRLRLGYTRAARIIDMMEADGMVGPYEGSKPRKILVDRDSWLENDILNREGKQSPSGQQAQ